MNPENTYDIKPEMKAFSSTNTAGEVTVTVSVEPYDNVDYYIKFTFQMGGILFAYEVAEPDIVEMSEWQKLARGENVDLNFYQGNGDGYICSNNRAVKFVSSPSGSGGDTIAEFTVAHAIIAGPLRAALNHIESQ